MLFAGMTLSTPLVCQLAVPPGLANLSEPVNQFEPGRHIHLNLNRRFYRKYTPPAPEVQMRLDMEIENVHPLLDISQFPSSRDLWNLTFASFQELEISGQMSRLVVSYATDYTPNILENE